MITDGWRGYSGLAEHGFRHEVRPGSKGGNSLAHVRAVTSQLKRWLQGACHGASSPESLDFYLEEYCFRFNRRKPGDRAKLFRRLIGQALDMPPLTYRDIRPREPAAPPAPVREEDVNTDCPQI